MKNKPIAYRRILIVASIGLILSAGAVTAYGIRKHRLAVQTARWRDEGIRAEQAGDYPRAVDQLELSLSRQPDDRDALLAYIDARPHVEMPKFGHLVATARALQYLLQLNPGLTDQRQQLMSLYQRMGLRTETLDTANTLLKSDPKNALALQVRAETLARLKRYDDSLAATDKWAAVEPLNLDAQMLRFSLMHQLGQPATKIDAALKEWQGQNPAELARFQLLSGVVFAQSGDRDNALQWLRKAAQQTPPDSAFSEILIGQLAQIGDQGEDVAVLQNLVDHGADAKVRQALLCRRWELGQWQEVVDLAAKLDLNTDATAANSVALTCMAQKNLGDAAGATRLTKTLANRGGDVAAAWTTILRSSAADAVAWRGIVEPCRKALAVDSANSYLRYFLGEALAATGEMELAVESMQAASEANASWATPPARMAELLLAQGNLQAASQAAMVSLHRHPNGSAAMTVARVVAALDQRQLIDPQILPKLVDELDRMLPGNEDVALLRIQALARDGSADKAVEKIHQLLKANPAPTEATLIRLAQLSESKKLGAEAEILETSAKLHGVTPSQVFALATRDAAAGEVAAGLKRIDAGMQNAPAAKIREWAIVRAQYLDANASDLAPKQWREISSAYPGDSAIQQAALASRAMRTDRPFLEQTLQRLRGILGDQGLVCTLARIRLLIDNRAGDADDREIVETLRQVIAAHPAIVEPRLLWAQNLERTGHIDEAIDQLENAQRVDPSATGLALKLAGLYIAKGDPARARKELQRVGMAGGCSIDEALAAAQILNRLGDFSQASAVLESTRSTGDNRVALLLAELYWRQNKPKQVEALIPALLEKPTVQTIEFAARFRASQGQSAEAERTLAAIDTLKIRPAEKSLARGNYLAATGHPDDAAKQYQQATVESPDSASAWRTLIAQLATTGRITDATAAAKDAARHLPLDGSFAQIEQAMSQWRAAIALPGLKSLVLEFIAEPSKSPAARDILGTVQQAIDTPDPLAALSTAQSLAQRYPAQEGVVLWTASVELRCGHPADAAALLSGAMETLRGSAEVAAMATRLHLARSQWKDALTSAVEWRRRSANPEQADIAQARALLGLNRPEEAQRLLRPYLPGVSSKASLWSDVVLVDAEALQASSKSQEAVSLLLDHAADGADWRAICLQFATAKLDIDNARIWVSRVTDTADASSKVEAPMLARAWAMLAARDGAKQSDRDEASRRFDAIVSQHDVTAPELEQAGMFAEQTGNPAKAMTLYLRALQIDPRRAIAQNNLAMVIATTGGNLEEASTHAAAAVAADRAEPAFLDTFAAIRARAGDSKAAVESMRKAVDLDPENPQWRVALAQVYFDSGRTAESSEALLSVESMTTDRAALAPPLRKQIDELREKLRRLQGANVSAATPLTVAH